MLGVAAVDERYHGGEISAGNEYSREAGELYAHYHVQTVAVSKDWRGIEAGPDALG